MRQTGWKFNHLLVLLLHCVFMLDLGCFPRDRSTPHPGPDIIRHERELGNDPGLQALDCCEPCFTTLMSEDALLESGRPRQPDMILHEQIKQFHYKMMSHIIN